MKDNKLKIYVVTETIQDILLESYNFTFVRNPWDRILSLFIGQLGSDLRLRKTLSCELQVNINSIELNHFESFVDIISKQCDIKSDNHYVSQSYLLDNFNCGLDFIGKFETLNQGWKELQKLFYLEDLKTLNKTKHYPYQYYYNKRTRRLISERYKEDILRFGYSFS